jgi:hypothetical protein
MFGEFRKIKKNNLLTNILTANSSFYTVSRKSCKEIFVSTQAQGAEDSEWYWADESVQSDDEDQWEYFVTSEEVNLKG